MSIKDNGRKERQWSFTIVSFDHGTIDCLSKLPLDDVVYVGFAICDDDAGGNLIEGYIKTCRPMGVAGLVRLSGCYGFFKVCSTPTCVSNLLDELKTRETFAEFGMAEAARNQGSCKDLASFKLAVEAGMNKKQLNALYPQFFSQYPGLVNGCLCESEVAKMKKFMSKRHEEWRNVGSPPGLPWKV
ncbi:hypothetical protein ACA910_013943 [Epithemia clementina (nom. ined.)]